MDTSEGLQIRVLGPVQVSVDGSPIKLGGSRTEVAGTASQKV